MELLQHIPTINSHRYYFRIGQRQKAKEIQDELLDIWKESLEEKTLEILDMITEEPKLYGEKVFGILRDFQKYSLPVLKTEKVFEYWQFLSQFGSIFLFREEAEELSNFISIIDQVIGYFEHQFLGEEALVVKQMKVFRLYFLD